METSKFKLYNRKNNPCPICGGGSQCRENLRWNGDGVLCHGYSSANLDEIIEGVDGRQWKCRKPQSGGHTASFGVYKGQAASVTVFDPEKEELKRKKEHENWLVRLAAEMSIAHRHDNFSKIIGYLSLSPEDAKNLCDRGFTDEQIALCGFRSVEQWQKIGAYPENLPGYNADRQSLKNVNAGILCPIPTVSGEWVAAQIRGREVVEDEGRYRWLSNSHLKGEMPIACWDLETKVGDAIWALEGTSIKPALAHFKLGVPVIGASGGLFASSPQNFRKSWEHLSQKYATKKLVLAIDAGDVVNPHVVHRLFQQFTLFGQLGCEVTIAWWGQVEKSLSEDIDELTDFGAIQYLAVEEFKVILAAHKPARDAKIAEQKQRVQDSKAAKQPIARSDRKKEERDREVRSQSLPQAPRPNQWNGWLAMREYTPDTVQSSKYVQFDAPAPGTILAVRSGLGSGKTHQLEALFEKGGAFEDKGAIALFARNSLIFNFQKRISSFTHLNEERQELLRDPHSRLALCTNSLRKFSNPEWFDGKILVIDEFSSVALHIACSNTHRKDRIEALEIWREVFVRCESVIILDGNLTNWQVEWAGKQAPGKHIVKLENTCERAKAKVEIFLGTPTKSGKFDSSKLSPYITPIMAVGKRKIVFSDSQKLLEQVDDMLVANGVETLRIDSKTIKKDSPARLFLDDCNAWLPANPQTQVVLISPSATSGVDIDNNKIQTTLNQLSSVSYFPHSYGLFRGVVATDDQMQMMARYRDSRCHWHISVPKQSFLRGSDRDYDLSNIQAAADKLMEIAEMDLSHLRLNKEWLGETFLKYIEEAKSNINVAFALKNRTKESFEKDNLRECLIFALEDAGHEVTQSTYFADNKVEAELKAAGEVVKKRVARQIFEADDIDEKAAEEISASWNSTWEDRCKVMKAAYRKLLPGIDETEHWTQEFIEYLKYDNPRAIGGANLLHLFKNPEIAAKQQKNSWAKIATERAVFLPDIYSPHLKVKALQFLKLEQFLECDRIWHKESPEIQELVTLGNRKRILASLGIAPRRTKKGEWDGMDYLRRILEIVGLKLGKKQQLQQEGKRINGYSLDAKQIADPINVAIAEAVSRRHTEFDTEWVMPEILQAPVQAIESPQPEIGPEFTAETDREGVDWRGMALQVKRAVLNFVGGEQVEAISQPIVSGESSDDWLIWVKCEIGRVQLQLGILELYFE